MFILRSSLATIIVAILCVALPTCAASASPSLYSTFYSGSTHSASRPHTEAIHVTLRTQEGLERFTFSSRQAFPTEHTERHFAGYARPRTFQTDKLPASLTLTESRAWIFFISRRTGRPVAATISLNRENFRTGRFSTEAYEKPASRMRVSRVPEKALECGSHTDVEKDLPTASATKRKRRVNRSPHSRISAASSAPFSPPRVLEVATAADFEFFRIHQSDTNTFIRAVLNAVDVIYMSSIGVKIKVISQRVSKTDDTPSGEISALSLLEEFRESPFASSSNADVRHLFTGRAIEGLTIGIAYVAAACTAQGRYAVGLSRDVSTGLHPFLAAHEIAHNLSATHDKEPLSIMNPAITTANNHFTSRALNDIVDFITTTGSCIAPDTSSAVRIRLNAKDPNRFATRVAFQSSSTNTCTVTLYGSGESQHFIPLARRSVRPRRAGKTTNVSFSAAAPRLSTPQSFLFKAKVSCGGTRSVSEPSRLQYGFASAGNQSSGGSMSWLMRLKRNLVTIH